MHEEKSGYFRYIKTVRRQNSDWGDYRIHACMPLLRNSKEAMHYSHGSHGARYSQVWCAVGSISILPVHVKTGKLILDQKDSKWQHITP